MRQLTEAEREALIKVNVDNIDYDNIEGFIKAGFIAGLGHAQAKIEALEAFIAGKITRDELEEVLK